MQRITRFLPWRKTRKLGFLRILTLVMSMSMWSFPALADLTVMDLNSGLTPSDLVTSLLGSGITVSNITYTGDNAAAGQFSGGTGIVGFEGGILLSSGTVGDVVGPNKSDGTTTQFGAAGDTDLDSLIPGYTTHDAAVLEFDFVPSGNQVTFQYVFGSEEYNEWVHSGFNDVFGFFINGTNYALLSDGVTPVSINNVNGGNPFGTDAQNPTFYVNNDLDDGGGAINIEADGQTVVLTLTAPVNAGVTNHIKLAISDAGDTALDSWVFIKAESFTVAENCTNGIDDDEDELVDYDDPDCQRCANGHLDPGEQCDDHNLENGDGCSAQCLIEPTPLDHFQCYKIKDSKGNICGTGSPTNAGSSCEEEEDCGGISDETDFCVPSNFPRKLQVGLADQFETKRFDVKKPAVLCNPASLDEGPIHDDKTHLEGYQVKQVKGEAKFVPQSKLTITNEFHPSGELKVDTTKAQRLLLPTAKSLVSPVGQPGANFVDHFKCYGVKISKKEPKFPKNLQVSVVDQFNQPKLYDVKKPTRLCTPVDKNGEGMKDPDSHLMCYQVKPAKKQPKHTRVVRIFVSNQFGPEQIDTIKEDDLCLPSTKALP